MAIAPFLAMTAAEMYNSSALPPKTAWMACHFSPYATGLSNLPTALPPGSLLMVDDITPPHGHDPVRIAAQLAEVFETLRCSGILLDFQRGGCEETQSLVKHLVQTLPCPIAVSETYAGALDHPVFLPPVPPSVPLEQYLLPWKGREVWLELGLEGEILTLTEQGCAVTPLPCPDIQAEGFSDEGLRCHYTIAAAERSARFTLWRKPEDLEHLLEDAEALGVAGAVGLFQELQGFTGLQNPSDMQKPLWNHPERS